MSDPAETEAVPGDLAPRLQRLSRPRSAERFEDALRHRRRVRRLRIALPLLAGLCLCAIFVSVVLSGRGDNHVAGSEVPGIEMHAPILRGAGSNGKPFEVIADQAVQTHEGIVELTNVRVRMDLDDGTMILTAKAGTMQQSTGQGTVNGDVHVDLGETYHFITERAKIDFKASRITGDAPVKVNGPSGTSEADGFVVEKSIHQVTLLGSVKSVLDPKTTNVPTTKAPPAAPRTSP